MLGRARRRSREALSAPGAILIVGERLADRAGRAVRRGRRWPRRTGAKLAWVPRRAGDRGAVDAGCLPNLLPGGRPVTDAGRPRPSWARRGTSRPGVIPSQAGRDTDGILAAAADGQLGALVVGGVDPADLADPRLAEQALDAVPFLVSLELRRSAVTRRADVVLPVAPVVEKAGTLPGLGGPAAPVRGGAEHRRDDRRPGARRARRAARRRARHRRRAERSAASWARCRRRRGRPAGRAVGARRAAVPAAGRRARRCWPPGTS